MPVDDATYFFFSRSRTFCIPIILIASRCWMANVEYFLCFPKKRFSQIRTMKNSWRKLTKRTPNIQTLKETRWRKGVFKSDTTRESSSTTSQVLLIKIEVRDDAFYASRFFTFFSLDKLNDSVVEILKSSKFPFLQQILSFETSPSQVFLYQSLNLSALFFLFFLS